MMRSNEDDDIEQQSQFQTFPDVAMMVILLYCKIDSILQSVTVNIMVVVDFVKIDFEGVKMMQKLGDFNHVLQPVRDTREKQIQLWKELILDYCKSQKVFLIGVEDSPLFSNSAIDRTLKTSAIVGEGLAEWLDKGHRKCLIGQTSFLNLT
ncbi:hypothetical protein Bca52824_030588 [Brassica carinata]|uniref:ESCRT-II complex subunit VPS25 n=1 Tax=Brassica carinata TaxID=52824 RepID=A0A8X7V4K1_BRACI|nr:hypothetical protein Bca52824_030588 [Brassica carinata]